MKSIWDGCNCDDCCARRIARHHRLVSERINLGRNIARTDVVLDGLMSPMVGPYTYRPGSVRAAQFSRVRLVDTNTRRREQLRVLDAKLARDRELWDDEGRAHGNTRSSMDLARKLHRLWGVR